MTAHDVVNGYFAAMRKGSSAEEEMMALFTEDVIFIEPFTDNDEPAIGKEAVRARLRRGWEFPLPEVELDVLAIEVDGPGARTRWECRSPALPRPIQGEDQYTIRDGKIARLEVRLLDMDD